MVKSCVSRPKKYRKVQARPRLAPVIQQAGLPPEQLQRFVHAVVTVPNPLGEVTIKGEIRQHKAVRRLPHFETLYNAKVIDRTVFVVLEWYAARLALASAGLTRCTLAASGGGGGGGATITRSEVAVQANADLKWARSFIPHSVINVFDGVMHDDETFESVGHRCYPGLSRDRAKRHASMNFKVAAYRLRLGIGHVVNAD
ncbi:MAG: hypothetical protein JO290_12885 [Sphingomonadaceae bacterium]|nr:hypothetical protein [Sphingomonadaceae bacterium]